MAIVVPADAGVAAPPTEPVTQFAMPAPVVVSVGNGANLPTGGVSAGARGDGSVPRVQPNQVTAPDVTRPPSTQDPALQPAPAARAETFTYAEMFQEIGSRYELGWRMLAAQAYVESSFDSLALGPDGDLGLMQVLPQTWHEWAPVVDASDPFDSYSNVVVAAAYLDYLRTLLAERGHSDLRWVLVAYNWGPGQGDTIFGEWAELGRAGARLAEIRDGYSTHFREHTGQLSRGLCAMGLESPFEE